MKEITVRVWSDSVLFVKDEVYNDDELFEELMEEYVGDCDMDHYDIIKVKEHRG